jgi:tRNA threonylcarbamoyladenosine biosynthesis protein TsaB
LTRTLAIETTSFTGGVALLYDDRVVAERRLPDDSRSAQSLAPAIQAILAEADWLVGSLNLIAVAQGPGSFTGLRVGVTTAKTLAYAIGAEVLGIDTLEVLAAQVGQASSPARSIHAILDAQRNQLFAATFTWLSDSPFPRRESATAISDLAPFLASLLPGDVVIGPVLPKIAGQLPDFIIQADPAPCEPQAATIGRLAYRDWQSGRRHSLWTLAPEYYRPSAAEEKRSKTQA